MFHPLDVERYLSEREHGVACDFSESGVHPMTLRELADIARLDMEAFLGALPDYPRVKGSSFPGLFQTSCQTLNRDGLIR